MLSNKNVVAAGACVASLLALGGVAQAQITFSSGGSLTAWNGSPVYTSLANSSLSLATTAQANQVITGSYGVMAETFTPSSSFTLGSFDLMMAVNGITAPTYQVNLFDLGAAGTVSVSSSSATYGAGTSLFADNTVTFSATTGGEVQGTFTLDAIDQVTLKANEEYALELWTPSADGQSGINWNRVSTADAGGQMFSGADATLTRETLAAAGQAGGSPRTGSLALYAAPAPEPASLALVGGGVALLGLMRRFKR